MPLIAVKSSDRSRIRMSAQGNSGNDFNLNPPPAKKLKTEYVEPQTSNVSPALPSAALPIISSPGANFSGGISLTISNGVINVKPAAGQATMQPMQLGVRTSQGVIPTSVAMVKGQLVTTNSTGQITSQMATLPAGMTITQGPFKLPPNAALQQLRAPTTAFLTQNQSLTSGAAITVCPISMPTIRGTIPVTSMQAAVQPKMTLAGDVNFAQTPPSLVTPKMAQMTHIQLQGQTQPPIQMQIQGQAQMPNQVKIHPVVAQKSLITGSTTRKQIKLPILNPAKISKQSQVQMVQPSPTSPGQAATILFPKGKLQLQNQGRLQPIASQCQAQPTVTPFKSQVQIQPATCQLVSQGPAQPTVTPFKSQVQIQPATGQLVSQGPAQPTVTPYKSQVQIQPATGQLVSQGQAQQTLPHSTLAQPKQVQVQQNVIQLGSQVLLQPSSIPLRPQGPILTSFPQAGQQSQELCQSVAQTVMVQSLTQTHVSTTKEQDLAIQDKQPVQTAIGQIRPQLQVQVQNKVPGQVMVRPQIRIQNTLLTSLPQQQINVQVPADAPSPDSVHIHVQDVAVSAASSAQYQLPQDPTELLSTPPSLTTAKPKPAALSPTTSKLETVIQKQTLSPTTAIPETALQTQTTETAVSQVNLPSLNCATNKPGEIQPVGNAIPSKPEESDDLLTKREDPTMGETTKVAAGSQGKSNERESRGESVENTDSLCEDVKVIISEEVITITESSELLKEIKPVIDTKAVKEKASIPELSVKIEAKEERKDMNTVDTIKEENSEIKMEKGCVDGNSNDTVPDFDPADIMEWEDGIGTLPGSDLKFKMNEFGCIELTEDLTCAETLDMSNDSDDTTEAPVTSGGDADKKSELKTEIKEESDDVCQCENCGEYGFASEFCKSGRFCSQTCVGAFDSKRMRGVKKHSLVSKLVLGFKKKRRKLLMSKIAIKDEDMGTLTTSVKRDGKKSKSFLWPKYLEEENATAASAKMFKEAYPGAKNSFKIGMKLEGVDPKHPSLYCVLSIAEVVGYRLRLHFDGFSECYDFWSNADSRYIFPCGFCEKNGETLQPPKGFLAEEFSWVNYLKLTKAVSAAKNLFLNLPVQSVTPNAFHVGMKVEAIDKKNNCLICVATVADTLGENILVHFDGWEDIYDYWCDSTSPYIHPVGWCQANGVPLSPPFDWDVESFTWTNYMTKTKSTAVPARAFKPRPQMGFEIGVKVELVDKRNPILIRVGSITEVDEFRVKVQFDGWSDAYDYWVDDDSPDIHPPGWCGRTGHYLTPPIVPSDFVTSPGQGGCPTPGCKGIGHIKGAKYTGHHSHFGCPYSQLNMNKETTLQDRLGSTRPEEGQQTPSPSPSSTRDFGLGPGEMTKSPEMKKCPTAGCDGSGHVTGKFPAHHRVSGCPLVERNLLQPSDVLKSKNPTQPDIRPKSTRGRKPRSYYLNMGTRGPYPPQKNSKEHEKKSGLAEHQTRLHQGIHQSVFMSAMVPNPDKDLSLCWEQHSKLLPGVDKIKGEDVSGWTIENVVNFITTLPGCEEQAKTFKDEQIDGEAFLLLNQTDIVKIMNIKLGPALKIYNSVLMFKSSLVA